MPALFKTDTGNQLKILDLIKQALEAQLKIEQLFASNSPRLDDMIYEVPGCLCIKMNNGRPEACGAMFADALPEGLIFRNGAGTKAVHRRRHIALRREAFDREATIKLMAKHLVGEG